MIRLRDIALPPEHNAHQLQFEAAQMLRISNSKIRQLKIVRRSVDARKKPDIKIIYTIDVAVEGSEQKLLRQSGCKKAAIVQQTYYKPPKAMPQAQKRPVVVGFGPAGMFAALILAMAGQKPIVLERGADAATRHEKVEAFFATGKLDERSNVQFGEGGAGTFSDGKLNTGVNPPYRLDFGTIREIRRPGGYSLRCQAPYRHRCAAGCGAKPAQTDHRAWWRGAF